MGDFANLTDIRNIDLFRAFIIFLDEMAHADKADIENLKEIITAEFLTRRPMGTNASVNIEQKATFIGTSNLPLEVLIRDSTGTRRFAEVIMTDGVSEAARELINAMNWAALWRAVDPTGPDPMGPFMGLLAQQQSQLRQPTSTEVWLHQFRPTDQPTAKAVLAGSRLQHRPCTPIFGNGKISILRAVVRI